MYYVFFSLLKWHFRNHMCQADSVGPSSSFPSGLSGFQDVESVAKRSRFFFLTLGFHGRKAPLNDGDTFKGLGRRKENRIPINILLTLDIRVDIHTHTSLQSLSTWNNKGLGDHPKGAYVVKKSWTERFHESKTKLANLKLQMFCLTIAVRWFFKPTVLIFRNLENTFRKPIQQALWFGGRHAKWCRKQLPKNLAKACRKQHPTLHEKW